MTNRHDRLANAPIVEAVVDIDCDLPASPDISALEARAREAYTPQYPKARAQLVQGFQIEQPLAAEPHVSARRGVEAYAFFAEDEKQVVQVRTRGFSFNRLAPYTTLDDYLPEIERTWRLFVAFSSPAEVRLIRLRYINRIRLPLVENQVDLSQYIGFGPHYPDQDRLTLLGFLNQYAAIDKDTEDRLNVTMTTQPMEDGVLPVVFDINAFREEPVEPDNWDSLVARIQSLRLLKNRTFQNTLTQQCLDLFR